MPRLSIHIIVQMLPSFPTEKRSAKLVGPIGNTSNRSIELVGPRDGRTPPFTWPPDTLRPPPKGHAVTTDVPASHCTYLVLELLLKTGLTLSCTYASILAKTINSRCSNSTQQCLSGGGVALRSRRQNSARLWWKKMVIFAVLEVKAKYPKTFFRILSEANNVLISAWCILDSERMYWFYDDVFVWKHIFGHLVELRIRNPSSCVIVRGSGTLIEAFFWDFVWFLNYGPKMKKPKFPIVLQSSLKFSHVIGTRINLTYTKRF